MPEALLINEYQHNIFVENKKQNSIFDKKITGMAYMYKITFHIAV